jgi:hypothetical protein
MLPVMVLVDPYFISPFFHNQVSKSYIIVILKWLTGTVNIY